MASDFLSPPPHPHSPPRCSRPALKCSIDVCAPTQFPLLLRIGDFWLSPLFQTLRFFLPTACPPPTTGALQHRLRCLLTIHDHLGTLLFTDPPFPCPPVLLHGHFSPSPLLFFKLPSFHQEWRAFETSGSSLVLLAHLPYSCLWPPQVWGGTFSRFLCPPFGDISTLVFFPAVRTQDPLP